jgi:3-oxoacyl-[acyl-carrier protein] reductase
MTLAQPVALVTGAGRNIGREIALALAANGHALAVNVRASVAEGQAVVDEIIARGGHALLCTADVSDQMAVAAMLDRITREWGRLDVLVNNAAIRREAELETLSAADWHATLGVVLDGAFFCTQAALPLLKASAQAAIVNIGGLTAHTGAANRVHVVTAKAGLVGLTRALAHGVDQTRRDAVDGDAVGCQVVRQASSASAAPTHHATHKTLLGRRGTAEEVAQAVVYLASGGARFITGQVLHVNGGTYLGG